LSYFPVKKERGGSLFCYTESLPLSALVTVEINFLIPNHVKYNKIAAPNTNPITDAITPGLIFVVSVADTELRASVSVLAVLSSMRHSSFLLFNLDEKLHREKID